MAKATTIAERLEEISIAYNSTESEMTQQVLKKVYDTLAEYRDERVNKLISLFPIIDLSYDLEDMVTKEAEETEIVAKLKELTEQLEMVNNCFGVINSAKFLNQMQDVSAMSDILLKYFEQDIAFLKTMSINGLKTFAKTVAETLLEVNKELEAQREESIRSKAKDMWVFYNALRDPDRTGKKEKGKGFTVTQAMQILLAHIGQGKGGNPGSIMAMFMSLGSNFKVNR